MDLSRFTTRDLECIDYEVGERIAQLGVATFSYSKMRPTEWETNGSNLQLVEFCKFRAAIAEELTKRVVHPDISVVAPPPPVPRVSPWEKAQDVLGTAFAICALCFAGLMIFLGSLHLGNSVINDRNIFDFDHYRKPAAEQIWVTPQAVPNISRDPQQEQKL